MIHIKDSIAYNVPEHIAFIVDGNRRWAQRNNKPISLGYRESFERIKNIILYAKESNISYISFFVLSTENLNRDPKEVDSLMNFFCKSFKNMSPVMVQSNIKIIFSGRKEELPDKVTKEITALSLATQNCKGITVNFCLNYGGKSEIADACKSIAQKVSQNQLSPNEINVDTLEKYLYNELPSVDFVVRTSGEKRISNFMIWQIAYAELYFVDKCFPDFDEALFYDAINEFKSRKRRFGAD